MLGKFDGEILAYGGPEHHLLVGASRSGKGTRAVPTLLAWPHSTLVLDVKGELADGDSRDDFVGTAGFRESLGEVLRFAPTRGGAARFNPLFEVRRGDNEVRDVQNVVDNHFGRLAGAAFLSAPMSVVANEAEDDSESGFGQSVGDAQRRKRRAVVGASLIANSMCIRHCVCVQARQCVCW